MTRTQEAGVSLLNVLVILAVGTGLVQVMLSDQSTALDRLETAQDTAQAHVLADGGITSVAVALRRDFETAPDADHLQEPWARAVQDTISLDFGAFAVAVEDARGKFDLNALGPAALAEQRVFSALLGVLDLPDVLAARIVQGIAQNGPLNSPDELIELGVAVQDVDRLRPHVTALTQRGSLNINAISAELMIAVLANETAARGLVARRAAKGFLDAGDLAALGVAMPQLTGFTSDVFDVRVVADVGQGRATRARRMMRDVQTGRIRDLPIPN